jgi:hypothetical protein
LERRTKSPQIAVYDAEIGAVEEIEEIKPPLQIHLLGDAELTPDIKIQLRERESPEGVAPKVSLPGLRRDGKCCRIDSPSPGQRGILDIKGYTWDQVWPNLQLERGEPNVSAIHKHVDG